MRAQAHPASHKLQAAGGAGDGGRGFQGFRVHQGRAAAAAGRAAAADTPLPVYAELLQGEGGPRRQSAAGERGGAPEIQAMHHEYRRQQRCPQRGPARVHRRRRPLRPLHLTRRTPSH